MDKGKVLEKILSFKDLLKTCKQVYERDLETFTFYNKKDLKDFKVIMGKVIDEQYIEFSMHLPKELDLTKNLFFMDKDGMAYIIDKESIKTTYTEVTLKGKVEQHPVTTCKYRKVKLLITE